MWLLFCQPSKVPWAPLCWQRAQLFLSSSPSYYFKWESAADQRLVMLGWSCCVLCNEPSWFVWISCCDRLQTSAPNEAEDSGLHFTYNKHNNLGCVVGPACLVQWDSLVRVFESISTCIIQCKAQSPLTVHLLKPIWEYVYVDIN